MHGIALDLSQKTAFDLDRPELFYYVREPQVTDDYERHAQGFAKSIEFMSELYDGMVSVDGLLSVAVGLGEHILCEVKPEYALKSIKFLI